MSNSINDICKKKLKELENNGIASLSKQRKELKYISFTAKQIRSIDSYEILTNWLNKNK